MVALMGESMELSLVGFKVVDEVYEVLGLGELLKVLCVDHIAKLVFDLNHELDDIE